MLKSLKQYYERERIASVNFHCQHRFQCSERYPKEFVEAGAGYVGPLYAERRLPRLLFLSLDPRALPPSPAKRTVYYVRQEVSRLIPDPRNPHWKYTHQMAYHLLHQFKPDLKVQEEYDKEHGSVSV